MTTAPSSKSVPSLGYGDYLRFSQLVHERCGLHFPVKRRVDLEAGVRQAFAASTCTDLGEYYRLLQNAQDGAIEMDRLINALTISETHFFRNAGHFNALYSHVLPQIIARRRNLRTLRIWSAGCASGEEPYSIAMMLRELLPDVDQWSITILGTDINTESLGRARKAVYSNWAFREERAKQWRSRYFRLQSQAPSPSKGKAASPSPKGERYALIPQVQRMVTFAQLNLAEDNYPSYESNTTLMDLILCRNVTIYFTESVTVRIIERFYDALVDGGWLVVGHAEHSLTTYRRFQARNFPDAILYQRTGQPTVLPPDWEWLTPAAREKTSPPPVTIPTPFTPTWFDTAAETEETPQPSVIIPTPFTPTLFDAVAGTGKTSHPPVTIPAPAPAPIATPSPPPTRVDLPTHSPEPEEGDPLERARELLDLGRSEQARDILLQLIGDSRRPTHAPACAALGQAYANLGCWQEAEDWCRQALRWDKLSLEAYYTLALVLQHQRQLDQAIEAMKKVVYLDRNNVLGHFGLAGLYRSNGQLPRALKSLDNARRLLEGRADDELVSDSGGITVARLRQTTIRQQQQWGAEANGKM